MSVTIKFSDEEFNALLNHFLGGAEEDDIDYDGLIDTIKAAGKLKSKKTKPSVNAIWEALKGVVG